MNESGLRRVVFPIVMILLGLLSGLFVNALDFWVVALPALALAVVVFTRPFWGLVLFAFLIPLESSFLSLGGGAASLTRFLGIFIFGVWALWAAANRRRIRFPFAIKPAVVFILWGCVSILWAFSKDATLTRIFTAAQLVMLMLLVVNMVTDRKKLGLVLVGFLLGCAVVTLLGLAGFGVAAGSRLLTLENQGAKEYGSYVGIVFLAGSILFLFEKKRLRWWGLAAVIFAMLPLFRVSERGIFLAIGVAWLGIALFTRQKARVFIFIVLMTLGIYFLPGLLEKQGLITSHHAARLDPQDVLESGGAGRTKIWGTGFRMFKDNVLTGVGWGNFPFVFNRYSTPNEISASNLSANGKDAHGDLVGLAGELGILGVVIFLFFYGRILSQDIVSFQKYGGAENKILAILVIALLIYVFAVGLTSTFLWRKMYWLILGMAIVLPYLLRKNERRVVARDGIL